MQALNLMIPDDSQVIFILGMDREKVAASIALKQKDILQYLPPASMSGKLKFQDDPASAKAWEYGYTFLEKFIQLPFLVPQPSGKDFETFLRKHTPLSSETQDSSETDRSPKESPKLMRRNYYQLEIGKNHSPEVHRIILMVAPLLD